MNKIRSFGSLSPKVGPIVRGLRDAAVYGLSSRKVALRLARLATRQRDEVALLRASPLFDGAFYREACEEREIPLLGLAPVVHFLVIGAELEIPPHPLFDVGYYRAVNDDVAASGINPLLHYLRHGYREGRAPCAAFDPAYYAAQRGAARTHDDPVIDYLHTDPTLAVSPHRLFDAKHYKAINGDVVAQGANLLVHFLRWGWREGRRPNPLFDPEAYLARNPDVRASGQNPFIHFLRYGRHEGRTANASERTRDAPEPWQVRERWGARARVRRLNALYVDLTIPMPDKDSGSITSIENMRALQALGYAVTFVPTLPVVERRYADALEHAGIECLDAPIVEDVHEFLYTYGPVFDVIFISRVQVACGIVESVRSHCPRATMIFETMDLHHVRERRQAELAGDETLLAAAENTRRIELDVIRRADCTIVHSLAERALLARETPEARVMAMPYVLEARGRIRARAGRRDLVFVGGFAHRPNVDAVLWFVRDVLPRVRARVPDVALRVVGPEPTPEILALAGEGVEILGHVPDLTPVLEACVVTVAPLRFGAGYKGKIAMSLAYGVPVVCTSIAAEGMAFDDCVEVAIADTPDEFAARIEAIVRDEALWETMSHAGLARVERDYSRRAARACMEDILRVAGAAPWHAIERAHAGERTAAPDQTAPTRRAGHAIFPSRFMSALYERAGIAFEGSHVVPHGVRFDHDVDAARARRDVLVEDGVLRLLFAGRITRFKGVHTILEALPEVVDRLAHLDVRLTIVGDQQDADYIEELRTRAAELDLTRHVELRPAVGERELFALFQEHDVYLFPSLFEPFALTLILALESGIPTIASTAGGNVDIVRDNETGLLFATGDAPALADRIIELAARPALRSAISARAVETAQTYTFARMMDSIESILAERVERAGAKGPG